MKIQSINYYNNINQNYNNKNVNFGYLNFCTESRILHKANPVINFFDNYYQRIAGVSKKTGVPISSKIAPFLIKVDTKNQTGSDILLWDINKKESKKYLIIMHGLGHNVSRLQPLYTKILDNTDFAVLALEYHGCVAKNTKKSSIAPKEFIQDADASLEYLQNKGINHEDIYVMGHSFGCYVASELAAKHDNLSGLILVSPVNAGDYVLQEMQNDHINNMTKFAKFMTKHDILTKLYMKSLFNIKKCLKQTKAPVSIIYSQNDKLYDSKEIAKLTHACTNLNNNIQLTSGKHIIEDHKIKAIVSILNKKDI